MIRLRLILLALVLVLTQTATSAAQTASATIKDADTARGFALRCPGCGHIYTGETGKGVTLAAIGIGSLIGGSLITYTRDPQVDCSTDGEFYSCEAGSTYTPLIAGVMAYLAAYAYGFMDAGPSASRMNLRNGIMVGSLSVTPVIGHSTSAGTEIGFQLQR